MQSLGTALAEVAAQRGNETAILFDGVHYTYRLMAARAATVGGALTEHGVQPGDRVAVGLTNSPELVAAVLGVLRIGAVLVPFNPAASIDEVTHILNDSGARVAVVETHHAIGLIHAVLAHDPKLLTAADTIHGNPASAIPVDADQAALMIYTSGTTGLPKGAVLSHRALSTNLSTVATAWQWTEQDRLLLTLPCFHLHGLGLGILTSMLVGASVVLKPRFVLDEILDELQRTRATMFFGVPTIYNRLVTLADESIRAHDLSRVRLWVCGSAPLTTSTFEQFHRKFDYKLMDRYGMTECAFVLSTDYTGERRPGVVGRPLPGIDVRLVDVEQADRGVLVDVEDGVQGEILIKGPNLFQGYWNRADATRAALLGGYLRSGDVAVREADGQIRILGRSSVDIIKTRGFKVGAGEIEDCLQRHPAVEEVAVVGVQDADQGERLVAAVILKKDSSANEEELRNFARGHLAPHKVPSEIRLVRDLPRVGPGKIKKRELIAQLTSQS